MRKLQTFGMIGIVVLLCSVISPAVSPSQDKTRLNLQLHTAAYKGDAVRVVELLGEGAEIDSDVPSQNGTGYENGDTLGGGTALMAALSNDKPEIVRLLLGKGASPNAGSANGRRPVLVAIEKRQPEMLRLLLKKGAKLKPISYEAMIDGCYSKDVMSLLLKRGLSPNTSEKGTGWTILMTCILEQPSSADILLSNGASVTARDHFHRSALFVAELDRLRLLDRERRHRALVEKDIQELDRIIAKLLSRGGDKKDVLTAQFLHAAESGDLPLVKRLLARGVPVNAYDFLYSLFHRGATALMLATQQGHSAVVHFLLHAGASPRLKDTDGNGVFFYANHGLLKDPKHKPGTLATVKALIEGGANVNEDLANEERLVDKVQWLDGDVLSLLKNAGARSAPSQAVRAE